jgi:hypothetical protein
MWFILFICLFLHCAKSLTVYENGVAMIKRLKTTGLHVRDGSVRLTKHRARWYNEKAEDIRFESPPGYRLSWQSIFVVFLSLFREILGYQF